MCCVVKHQKLYWNHNLTKLSKRAKSFHKDWLNSNRPASGPIYNNFKTSMRTFRREQPADKHVTDLFDELDKAAEVDHVNVLVPCQ